MGGSSKGGSGVRGGRAGSGGGGSKVVDCRCMADVGGREEGGPGGKQFANVSVNERNGLQH